MNELEEELKRKTEALETIANTNKNLIHRLSSEKLFQAFTETAEKALEPVVKPEVGKIYMVAYDESELFSLKWADSNLVKHFCSIREPMHQEWIELGAPLEELTVLNETKEQYHKSVTVNGTLNIDKPLPCPHCNNPVNVEEYSSDISPSAKKIECYECDIKVVRRDMKSVLATWNKRPKQSDMSPDDEQHYRNEINRLGNANQDLRLMLEDKPQLTITEEEINKVRALANQHEQDASNDMSFILVKLLDGAKVEPSAQTLFECTKLNSLAQEAMELWVKMFEHNFTTFHNDALADGLDLARRIKEAKEKE